MTNAIYISLDTVNLFLVERVEISFHLHMLWDQGLVWYLFSDEVW